MTSTLFVAILAALVAVISVSALTPELDADWHLFKFTHNKQYASDDHELARRAIWEANLVKINTHNLKFKLGKESYEVGMNHLGDFTAPEIKAKMNGWKEDKMAALLENFEREKYVPAAGFQADETVDWRTKGVVTPVKNQGQCGSCWAFSATGSLEGQVALKNAGKLISLSEQELVDCSSKEGNEGCDGGLMDQAFEYILKNKGIDTEESYPYTAHDGKCRAKQGKSGATVTGFVDIKEQDEKDLQSAIAEKGPISVAIDASQFGFQFYKSGVYYSEECSSTELDHGVLAVGYGAETGVGAAKKGGKYYIVKNSWGPSWGTKGYLLMARDRDNNCGIATKASYPKI